MSNNRLLKAIDKFKTELNTQFYLILMAMYVVYLIPSVIQTNQTCNFF